MGKIGCSGESRSAPTTMERASRPVRGLRSSPTFLPEPVFPIRAPQSSLLSKSAAPKPPCSESHVGGRCHISAPRSICFETSALLRAWQDAFKPLSYRRSRSAPAGSHTLQSPGTCNALGHWSHRSQYFLQSPEALCTSTSQSSDATLSLSPQYLGSPGRRLDSVLCHLQKPSCPHTPTGTLNYSPNSERTAPIGK